MLSPERMLHRKLENKKSRLDLWESEGPTVLPQINLQRLAKHLLCAKYYTGDGDMSLTRQTPAMKTIWKIPCRMYRTCYAECTDD